MILSCIGGGQKNNGSEESIEPVVDSVKIEAYQKFEELISLAYSDIHLPTNLRSGDIIDSSFSEDVNVWKEKASRVKEYSQMASEIIAPYDSSFYYEASRAASFADMLVFYANQYLSGEGLAYIDKCLVSAGHSASCLYNIQYELSRE
jgi:hypothetical protein